MNSRLLNELLCPTTSSHADISIRSPTSRPPFTPFLQIPASFAKCCKLQRKEKMYQGVNNPD